MKYFALVYKKDLVDNGIAYLWFNRQGHHVTEDVISVQQATYQNFTELKLLAEVQKTYPNAILFDDTSHPGSYRCIKVR